MKYLICFLFLICSVNAESSPDDIQWNRYEVDKFSILSIDNDQGKWLAKNLPNMKEWCYSRLGSEDITFKKECRIFCAKDKQQLNKLFSITSSKVKFQTDLNVMWLCLDDNPSKSVVPYLTLVCIHEANNKLPFWFTKGCSELSTDLQHLSDFKSTLDKDEKVMTSEKIFNLKQEEYELLSSENKMLFDTQSGLIVLMLRKEFGKQKLHYFVNNSNSLSKVYKYETLESFDKSYMKYCFDLTKDMDKIPKSYFNLK